jgi:hypothetical protein
MPARTHFSCRLENRNNYWTFGSKKRRNSPPDD